MHRGVTNAEMRLMDAEALAFEDGSFDRVLCSIAVFWFPHLEQALAEMHRVLRPGGTAAFAFTRGADPRWKSWSGRSGETKLRVRRGLSGQPQMAGV
ncbi:MAG: class I SAM-dependent methyltransferase [Chloroflexota bacterium]